MNPLTLNDTTNLFFEIDGGRHISHKFRLKTPDDYMIDTVLSGIKIANGIYDELPQVANELYNAGELHRPRTRLNVT